jgi:hypothetical protein
MRYGAPAQIVGSLHWRCRMRKFTVLVALAFVVIGSGIAFTDDGGSRNFRLRLTGLEEAPLVISTNGHGTFRARINREDTEIAWRLTYDDLEGTVQRWRLWPGSSRACRTQPTSSVLWRRGLSLARSPSCSPRSELARPTPMSIRPSGRPGRSARISRLTPTTTAVTAAAEPSRHALASVFTFVSRARFSHVQVARGVQASKSPV